MVPWVWSKRFVCLIEAIKTEDLYRFIGFTDIKYMVSFPAPLLCSSNTNLSVLTIQFNSDVVQFSSRLHKTTLVSDAGCRGVPRLLTVVPGWPQSWVEGPTVPRPPFDSSLEWRTELRKVRYLLWAVCSERHSSGRVKWKRCTGCRVWREGVELPCRFHVCLLPTSAHSHQPRSSPSPVLLGFCGSFLTLAWLMESLAVGD